MKKMFIWVFVCCLCMPVYGGTGWVYGNNNGCIAETGIYRSWWWQEDFYYCGKQPSGCANKNKNSRDGEYYNYHGDTRTLAGKKWWCCGGTQSTAGRWTAGDKWQSSQVVTKGVDGGTCSYIKYTTVCGEVIDNPCTVPDKCTDGNLLRNNVCVAPCKAGEVFKSEKSNECIECPETQYSGIKQSDNKGTVCIHCDEEKQFFDKEKSECINKSDMKQYTTFVMAKCFMCSSNEMMKKCMDVFSKAVEEQSSDSNYETVKKNCFIE